jgi:uncharacterized protein (TIGR00251 family)
VIQIDSHPDGIVLPVRAQPRARSARIVGEHAGTLKVAVTDPPEKGKANDAIIELLANHFRLKQSQVRLISGATSRNKRFLLVDQHASNIQMTLDQLLAKNQP